MLLSLNIRDIVLVKELNLNINNGLSVLTGETGAGKSILLDAIGLVIGGRGDSSLVRRDSTKAIVTAEFSIRENHPVWKILDDLDISYDCSDSLILKRTITNDGKSRAFINGEPTNIRDLRLIGENIVDVQGQFDQHGLLSTSRHMEILDSYSGTTKDFQNINNLYKNWKNINQQYNNALIQLEQAEKDSEYIIHCLNELEDANPQIGEEEELLITKAKLQNADKLLQSYQSAYQMLSGDDGADNLIGKTQRILERISDHGGEKVESIIKSLDIISSDLIEIIDSIETQAQNIQSEAYDLQSIEDRLYLLNDLSRKHRTSIDGLVSIMDNLKIQSNLLNDSDGNIEKLKQQLISAQDDYITACKKLSEKRFKQGKKLSKRVNEEIPLLGLSGSEFLININTVIPSNFDEASPNGIDTITFMARTNVGGDVNPIHKSASGGELSRLLLGINVALAETNTATTLMFDEVDAGVGGKSATSIGNRLLELAKTHQVIVITHSPQVAGLGNNHLFVEKSSDGSTTTSTISTLNKDERINEIARMLSGENITSEAKANAQTLIENK